MAYSVLGGKNIGYGKVTLVATDPSVDTLSLKIVLVPLTLSVGLKVTGSPITVRVGIPNSVVLIWTVIGAFPESTDEKNKSTAVKNAPF